MATVEHTADTTLGRIPLARRISELMDERGEAFSARALAARIGMNRETFRLILTEERRIMPQVSTPIENSSKTPSENSPVSPIRTKRLSVLIP